MAEAWDRIVKETMPAYKAFCIYRDLGDGRSIDAAYCKAQGHEAGTKTASGHWRKWAASNGWVDRAGAYDLYLELQEREVAEAARIEAKEMFAHAAIDLAATLIDVGLTGPYVEGKGENARVIQPSAAQVKALTEALKLAGVTVPQEIELKEAIPFTFIIERPADANPNRKQQKMSIRSFLAPPHRNDNLPDEGKRMDITQKSSDTLNTSKSRFANNVRC